MARTSRNFTTTLMRLRRAPTRGCSTSIHRLPFPTTASGGNQRRGLHDPEFELIDTGIFANDHYFDVFVEYAKADTNDVLMRITVHNRGPEAASLVLLPQTWFRNTWSWGVVRRSLPFRRWVPLVCRQPIRRLAPSSSISIRRKDFSSAKTKPMSVAFSEVATLQGISRTPSTIM